MTSPAERLPPVPADRFMRWHAQKVVAGATGASLMDLTLEAGRQAERIAERTALNSIVSFDITDRGADGDARLFDVTYADCRGRRLALRERVEVHAGQWKITRVDRARPSARGHR